MHQKITALLLEENFESAFNIMVKEYNQRLYWHVRRMVINHDDADDVLQNAFMNAWRALPKFRNDSNPYTWLYRIATNEALTFLRRKKEHVQLEDVEGSISKNLESDAFFNGNEAQAKLYEAIATLPEKQRAVFNLRYFEEMKYADISEVMNLSEGGLKANYHHAVKKIEAYIKNH